MSQPISASPAPRSGPGVGQPAPQAAAKNQAQQNKNQKDKRKKQNKNATPVSAFPAHATVKTMDKGLLPMYMLQVGDRVEAYDVRKRTCMWSPVKSFLLREPEAAVPCLVLGYSHPLWGFGAIACTPGQLVYAADRGTMVEAGSIQPGEHLFISHEGSILLVEATSSVTEPATGAYAPLTYAGTVMVDGAVCSCFPGNARKLRSQNRKLSRAVQK